MADEAERLTKPAVARALRWLGTRVMHGNAWPQWFVDTLQQLACDCFKLGVEHAHNRKTVDPPDAPDINDEVTPVRSLWKR